MASITSRAQDQRDQRGRLRDSNGLHDYKALVEEYLFGLGFSDNPRLAGLIEAMRCSFLGKSDRVRPVLCMEVAGTFGLDPAEVLPSATAIELIHTLSRIHGDLPAISDDPGSDDPAAYMEFGEATAILAGDAFFGEALALITNHQKGSPGQLLKVVRELATSTGANGMVGGQTLDLGQREGAMDPETLYALHGYKTGSLIEASARIGAILAGASIEDQEAVSRYAAYFGLCQRDRWTTSSWTATATKVERLPERRGVLRPGSTGSPKPGAWRTWPSKIPSNHSPQIDADTSGLATFCPSHALLTVSGERKAQHQSIPGGTMREKHRTTYRPDRRSRGRGLSRSWRSTEDPTPRGWARCLPPPWLRRSPVSHSTCTRRPPRAPR